MENEKVYISTIRFYKDRQLHCRAYEQLMKRDKREFKRKDDFIAEAIIHYADYLEQEAEKQEIKTINHQLSDENSFVYDILRNVLTEVMEEKLAGLCMDSHKVASDDEEPDEIPDCTDRDKRFAAFYDFDEE